MALNISEYHLLPSLSFASSPLLKRQISFNSSSTGYYSASTMISTTKFSTNEVTSKTENCDRDAGEQQTTLTVTGFSKPHGIYSLINSYFDTHDYPVTSSSFTSSTSLTSYLNSSYLSSSSSSSILNKTITSSAWNFQFSPEISSKISPEIFTLLSTIKTVIFDFTLCVDRIRVSWKDPDYHRGDQYQIRAYLLLNDQEDEENQNVSALSSAISWQQLSYTSINRNVNSKNVNCKCKSAKPKHSHLRLHKRQQGQKQLIAKPLVASRSLTLATTGMTEICFDNQEIAFRTGIPVLKINNGKDNSNKEISNNKKNKLNLYQERTVLVKQQPQYVFQSRVVRLKLERVRKHDHHQRVIIGFVDLDLAQLRHQSILDSETRSNGFTVLPMVLFTDYYSRHVLKHERAKLDSPESFFCFDIRLRLNSLPIPNVIPLPLDLWVSDDSLFSKPGINKHDANFMAFDSCGQSQSTQSLQKLSQYLYRCDSLPNLSKDKELKCK